MEVTIRPATPEDATDIAALFRAMGWFDAYLDDGDDGAPQQAELRALLDAALASDRQAILVGVSPATGLCAYCAVHWFPCAVQRGWEGYVSELFIADTQRGAGLGRQLLDAVAQAARQRGCKRLTLVNNRERASYQRGVYAKQGWVEQPEMARFVYRP